VSSTRSSLRHIAAAALIVTLAAPALAASLTDEFIKGYAAAILAREFKVRAASLQVSSGIVQLTATELGAADRSAVVAALTSIEGVKHVALLNDPARPGTAQSAPSDGLAARSGAQTHLLETGLLPPGLLFRPLIADPRWPRFSLGIRGYFDEDDFGWVIAGTLGESLPFYRWTSSNGHQWEVGAQAVVRPLFDRDHDDDLLTEDYLLGLFLGWRHGPFSGIARLHHTSSHLGDEFALRGGVQRVNVSYETLDVRLAWDFTPGVRLYAGAGYLIRRDPSSLDPWWTQLGLEYRSSWRAWQLLRPVAAIDLQSHETNAWHPALSLRAGTQVDSVSVLGRNLQMLLEYYVGDSRDGQFFSRDVQYLGFGVHFNF
jgi:uncharacterized protein DUF1207